MIKFLLSLAFLGHMNCTFFCIPDEWIPSLAEPVHLVAAAPGCGPRVAGLLSSLPKVLSADARLLAALAAAISAVPEVRPWPRQKGNCSDLWIWCKSCNSTSNAIIDSNARPRESGESENYRPSLWDDELNI